MCDFVSKTKDASTYRRPVSGYEPYWFCVASWGDADRSRSRPCCCPWSSKRGFWPWRSCSNFVTLSNDREIAAHGWTLLSFPQTQNYRPRRCGRKKLSSSALWRCCTGIELWGPTNPLWTTVFILILDLHLIDFLIDFAPDHYWLNFDHRWYIAGVIILRYTCRFPTLMKSNKKETCEDIDS